MAAITAATPGLSALANAVGGVNSSTFQDFLKIVNASPLYTSQLQDYLAKYGSVSANPGMSETGSNGQSVPVAGVTDPVTRQITINTAPSQLANDPTKGEGYALAEIVSHELGHVWDFQNNSNPGGLIGEARAEINSYNLMSQADQNLGAAGNIGSAAGGDLFVMNPANYLPVNGPSYFKLADNAIEKAISENGGLANLMKTCGVQSACEAMVANAMQQSGYDGYYPSSSSPLIVSSNGYNQR